MKTKYPDDFKLLVVKDYYSSPLGVRAIALKYNLPSKNYINNWEKQLIAKGLLPEGSTKPVKAAGRSKEAIARGDGRTEREIYYEKEIVKLKARIDYLESLEHLKPFIGKKKRGIRLIKYRVILSLEHKYPIWLLCQIALVSESSYYRYKRTPLKIETDLKEKILDLYHKSGKRAVNHRGRFFLIFDTWKEGIPHIREFVDSSRTLRLLNSQGFFMSPVHAPC